MKRFTPCDTHRLMLYILGFLGTLSLVCYFAVKVLFNKEPSEILLSGGFCTVISGILGNMGRGPQTPPPPTNSGVIVNETKEPNDNSLHQTVASQAGRSPEDA